MRRFAVGIAVGITLMTAASALAAGPWPGPYAWFKGDDRAGIGRLGSALSAFSNGDINIHGRHLRLEGEDGNVELESGAQVEATMLNPYDIGTSKRKPLQVGGSVDGQDVLSLIVAATPGQTRHIQEWRSGTKAVAAIDSRGRLRLGAVTLSTRVVGGHVTLTATLPDGKRQTLAIGR